MSDPLIKSNVTRRSFVKTATGGALATIAGGAAVGSMFGCSSNQDQNERNSETDNQTEDTVVWAGCLNWGCGLSSCPLQYHTSDGLITYIESDNTGDSSFGSIQARACLRGRSIRRFLNHPDRLQYPLRRTGKRGSGEFERISWDEALDLMEEKLRYTIEEYGNEAIFSTMTDAGSTDVRPFERLLNLLGGHLATYGADSFGCMFDAFGLMYGPYSHWTSGSPLLEACNADIALFFGNSPSSRRMGGGSGTYAMAQLRASGTRIVNIDFRLNESSTASPDEWLPIRPGTDAALASAMAYVLITEDLVDDDFLRLYTIGYDEQTMPESAPLNSSYKDYILGTGYDMLPKTPEWAAPITKIPAQTIRDLALDIGKADSVYISQGYSIQRASNGENACRSIPMLALLTGNIGKPGTSSGGMETVSGSGVASFPSIQNPIETQVSCISRIDVIERGDQMTALRDGVRGKDKLETSVKFMWCGSTNSLTNQHGDINHSHDVLVQEDLCEFIAVSDVFMTPSAKYADLLLPSTARPEREELKGLTGDGSFEGAVFGRQIQKPQGECRNEYDWCSELAERFGVKDQYTEGRSYEDWQVWMWDQWREERPDLPTYEQGFEDGLYKKEVDWTNPFADFIKDPEANPLSTASGKIEIYIEEFAKAADTWEFESEKDIISPIPIYNPGYESYEDCNEQYPLTLAGWHPRQRSHSMFSNVESVDKVIRNQVWINPIDASDRNIENGDKVQVSTMRGTIQIEARVTPRIIPGSVGLPQGRWHDADMDGDRVDIGGSMNTLCSVHLTPYSKHNPSNSNIAQIVKV